MKSLLKITALFEGATGLALIFIPSMLVSILLGTSLTEPGAILICRVTGIALITIAIACWLSRSDIQSAVMMKAMVVYNVFSIIILVYASLVEKMYGPGLWPAVLVHLVLLIWCLSSLRKPMQKSSIQGTI